jgi:hypothetical protein
MYDAERRPGTLNAAPSYELLGAVLTFINRL